MIVFLAISLLLYFVPAIASITRDHRQKLPIILLNVLLGWTVVGWVGALIWACIEPAPPVVIYQQAPPPAA